MKQLVLLFLLVVQQCIGQIVIVGGPASRGYVSSSSPPTLFGISPDPGNETANSGTNTITITPPSSMASGQLVVVVGFYRGASDITVTDTGGQTWNAVAEHTWGAGTIQILWSTFDGTWDSDPTFDSSADPNAFMACMLVFSSTGATWTVDVAASGGDLGTPGDPADVTMPGVTTTTSNVIIIGAITSDDDNTWSLQTAGWSAPFPEMRATGGADGSLSVVYRIQSGAGASGDVVNRQITEQPDGADYQSIAFRTIP